MGTSLRVAPLLAAFALLASTAPGVAQAPWELPVRWERSTLAAGWATLSFDAREGDVVLETEARGPDAHAHRIDVHDAAGRRVAWLEVAGNDVAPTAAVGASGHGVRVAATAKGYGELAHGTAWGGACLRAAYAGVMHASDGERATSALAVIDGACLGSGVHRAVVVAAGPRVQDVRFVLRAAGEPEVHGTRGGGSVMYIPLGELDDDPLVAQIEVAASGAALVVGAERTLELDAPWVGSFVASRGPANFSQARAWAAAPGGADVSCPCVFGADTPSGAWTFHAEGPFVGAPYLLAAAFEWP